MGSPIHATGYQKTKQNRKKSETCKPIGKFAAHLITTHRHNGKGEGKSYKYPQRDNKAKRQQPPKNKQTNNQKNNLTLQGQRISKNYNSSISPTSHPLRLHTSLLSIYLKVKGQVQAISSTFIFHYRGKPDHLDNV